MKFVKISTLAVFPVITGKAATFHLKSSAGIDENDSQFNSILFDLLIPFYFYLKGKKDGQFKPLI